MLYTKTEQRGTMDQVGPLHDPQDHELESTSYLSYIRNVVGE